MAEKKAKRLPSPNRSKRELDDFPIVGLGDNLSHESELGAPPLRSLSRMEASRVPKSDDGFQRPIAFNGLLTNKLLNGLPGEDFGNLLQFLEPISFVAGQNVFEAGQPIDYIYFPETAILSHLHFLEDGSSTATSLIGNEGVIGLSAIFDAAPTWCWTEVTIPGNAVRVKTEVIRTEFARGGAVQRLFLEYTRLRLAQLSQRAVCHGRHIMRERLCTLLLMVQDRIADEWIWLTHEKIAHNLGARRAGVSGVCNALRDLGIIRYQRGRIQIANRELLERLSCECYRTLRQFAG